jgi:hypothetical protein
VSTVPPPAIRNTKHYAPHDETLTGFSLQFSFSAGLRFFRLDAQSFWNDKARARVAERSLLLIKVAAIGIHPPLYYYALHFWRGLVGSSELRRAAIRASGILLVWLIYRLG